MSSKNPFPTLYSRAGSFNPAMYASSVGGSTVRESSIGGKRRTRTGNRKLSRYNRRSRKRNHSRTRRFRKF